MSRFRWVTQLGIVPRLATAFMAVALLAVAANTISQVGPRIVLLGREPVSTASPITRPEARAEGAPVASAQRMSPIETGKLLAAIERHARATRARADTPGSAYDAELASAAKALNAEIIKIKNSADKDSRPLPVAALRTQVSRQQTDATQLITAADERRGAAARYLDAFEQLDSTIKREIDRAWKILGRVIARQSLIDLSRKMDSLRPMVAKLTGPEPADATVIASTEAEEASISAELQSGSSKQAWRQSVQTSFDGMRQIRLELRQFDVNFDQRRAIFTAHTEQLRVSAHNLQEASSAVPAAASSSLLTAESGAGPPNKAEIASYAKSVLTAPYSPIVQTPLLPAPVRNHDRGRQLLIWISGGVLLLLLVICVGTVISIVRPVNRLMAATRRLAAGDLAV